MQLISCLIFKDHFHLEHLEREGSSIFQCESRMIRCFSFSRTKIYIEPRISITTRGIFVADIETFGAKTIVGKKELFLKEICVYGKSTRTINAFIIC